MSTDDINTRTTMGADDIQGIITSVDSTASPNTMQITTDIHEDEDVHICAKCKIPFTSLEAYFEHKMTSKTCGKEFNNTRKSLLKRLGPRRGRPPGRKRQSHDSPYTPALVKKEPPGEDASNKESKSKSDGKGEKYNRLKLHHRLSDIIPNTVLYKCDLCDSQFKREAALKRHKEYDHRENDSDESSEDENVHQDKTFGLNKQHITDESQSSGASHLVESATQVKYVETLTFDPNTGFCTTSRTPTIIETEASFTLQSAEQTDDPLVAKQIVVVDWNKDEQDPDYAENKVNYLKSGRRTHRLSASSRKGLQHGNKQNVCSKCGRSFANALTLSTHQLTHSNVRNFKCTVPGCSYAFKTKGSLKRHMRRHTGERPYKCRLCHRAFRESGALNRHLKGRVPCTDKTDADFPRYKKNLKLPTAVNVKQETVEASTEQSPCVLSSEQDDSQKDHTLQEQTESESDRMVILVPVSVMDNEHINEEVTTDSQCSLYDNSQVLPEQMMMMTVSEDELNANQGLSLVIEDNCQSNEIYTETSQEATVVTSEQDLTNSSLVETTDVFSDPLLEREEGELIEIKGDEPLIVGGDISDTKDERNSSEEVFVCKVDGKSYTNCPDLISHLKTHLINVNYHCQKCNYFSESRTQMDEHIQLTHLKQWISQPSNVESSIMSKTANEISSVQDVTMATEALPEMENMENIEFVATDNQVSEEIVSHGDEINTAVSSLEVSGTVSLSESGTTLHDSIRYSQKLEENTDNVQDRQHVESEANCVFPKTDVHNSNPSSDENIKVAVTALDQLMSLCQSSGPHHDYCQFDKSQCPVCGKKFKGNAYLKFHVRTHTGEKAFKCDQCVKSFATKDALNKHYMAHSMDKNYKCGECGKFFKRISHVREHLKVHTNERPYTCKLCLKTFKTVNACKVHIRTHSDDLQYKCDICGKQFREKGSLDRHIRTHTGEKPYPCPHCGRKFAEHGTLNRHLKAKVPCTRALQQMRISDEVTQVLPQSVDLLSQEKETISIPAHEGLQLTELSQAVKLEQPSADATRQHVKLHILPDGQVKEETVINNDETTVLREFSSVVADTQQYITDRQQQEQAEYIMVSDSQTEVMMPGNKSQEQVSYIVMGNDIIFIDQKSGEQIQLLTSDGESNKMMMAGMEVISTSNDDVQQIIEMPPGEEVIAMETDAGELMLGESVVSEGDINEEVLQSDTVT